MPEGSNARLGLTCDPAIPSNSELSISVGTGITSLANGTVLRGENGATDPALSLPSNEELGGCRTWRLPGAPVN
jgi:hypothetical protein